MDRSERLAASWDSNAENWTRAVRDRLIPSRRAGTDDAVVAEAIFILVCHDRVPEEAEVAQVLAQLA